MLKIAMALAGTLLLAGCSQTFSAANPPAATDYSRKAVNYRVAKRNDEKWKSYAAAGWCVPSAGSTFDKYARKGCTPFPENGGVYAVVGYETPGQQAIRTSGVLNRSVTALHEAGIASVAARSRTLFRAGP